GGGGPRGGGDRRVDESRPVPRPTGVLRGPADHSRRPAERRPPEVREAPGRNPSAQTPGAEQPGARDPRGEGPRGEHEQRRGAGGFAGRVSPNSPAPCTKREGGAGGFSPALPRGGVRPTPTRGCAATSPSRGEVRAGLRPVLSPPPPGGR